MVSSDLFFPNTLYFKSILRLMITGSSCMNVKGKNCEQNKTNKVLNQENKKINVTRESEEIIRKSTPVIT